MNELGFYRAFEDRYRGSREMINSRLEAYLPFITPFHQVTNTPKALDLGCGRGEWLELLKNQGFDVLGVDTDDGMLAACVSRGLQVEKMDIIEKITSLDDRSMDIISSFHVVEHIPFKALQRIFTESLRVLKPGGLLILETPNPENIVVGSNSFYLDPTHKSPIPSQLLSFMAEHYDFSRIRVLGLQEAVDIRSREHISLLDVLGGVSPDYAVVAQKEADQPTLAVFNQAFSLPYGIELKEIAMRYDNQIKLDSEQKMQEIHSNIQEINEALQAKLDGVNGTLQSNLEGVHEALRANFEKFTGMFHTLQAATDKNTALQHEIFKLKNYLSSEQANIKILNESITELNTKNAQPLADLRQAEATHADTALQYRKLEDNSSVIAEKARHFESENIALRKSLSWQLTGPLRAIGSLALPNSEKIKKSLNSIIRMSVEKSQRPVASMIKVILKNHNISHKINNFLQRNLPGLHHQLVGIARRHGLIQGFTSIQVKSHFPSTIDTSTRPRVAPDRRDASILLEEHSEKYAAIYTIESSRSREEFDFEQTIKKLRTININDIESLKNKFPKISI